MKQFIKVFLILLTPFLAFGQFEQPEVYTGLKSTVTVVASSNVDADTFDITIDSYTDIGGEFQDISSVTAGDWLWSKSIQTGEQCNRYRILTVSPGPSTGQYIFRCVNPDVSGFNGNAGAGNTGNPIFTHTPNRDYPPNLQSQPTLSGFIDPVLASCIETHRAYAIDSDMNTALSGGGSTNIAVAPIASKYGGLEEITNDSLGFAPWKAPLSNNHVTDGRDEIVTTDAIGDSSLNRAKVYHFRNTKDAVRVFNGTGNSTVQYFADDTKNLIECDGAAVNGVIEIHLDTVVGASTDRIRHVWVINDFGGSGATIEIYYKTVLLKTLTTENDGAYCTNDMSNDTWNVATIGSGTNVSTDNTLTGNGSSVNPLKVDTAIIATQYDLSQIGLNYQNLIRNGFLAEFILSGNPDTVNFRVINEVEELNWLTIQDFNLQSYTNLNFKNLSGTVASITSNGFEELNLAVDNNATHIKAIGGFGQTVLREVSSLPSGGTPSTDSSYQVNNIQELQALTPQDSTIILLTETGAKYLVLPNELDGWVTDERVVVTLSNSKFAHLQKDAGKLNLNHAGLKGDWVDLDSLSMTMGSNIIAYGGSDISFSNKDIGKTIVVWGAGRYDITDIGNNGDEHISIITAVLDSKTAQVSDTAHVTVSNNKGGFGTNDKPALESLIDYGFANYYEGEVGRNYFFNMPRGTSDPSIRIEQDTNITFNFNNATISSTTQNPESYIKGSEPVFNVFWLIHSSGITFENLIFKNIGQTQSRLDTLREGAYYSYLNGIPVQYDRLQNKTANSGAFVKATTCWDVTIQNCDFYNPGAIFISASKSNHTNILNNNIYGWALTAVITGSNCLIQNNFATNADAPILSESDRGNPNNFGTSHFCYATEGDSAMYIINNTIIGTRSSAIQTNTGTNTNGYNHYVSGNVFEDCFQTFTILGNNKLSIKIDDNVFKDCAELTISNEHAVVDVINNTFWGQYETVRPNGSAISVNFADTVIVKNNTFKGFSGSSGTVGAIKFQMQDTASNFFIVDDNFFAASNDYAVRVESSLLNLLNKLTIKDNDLWAGLYLVASNPSHNPINGFSERLEVVGNRFLQNDKEMIFMRESANIRNNEFYMTNGVFAVYMVRINLNIGSDIVNFNNNKVYYENGANEFLAQFGGGTTTSLINFTNNQVFGNLDFNSANSNSFQQFNNALFNRSINNYIDYRDLNYFKSVEIDSNLLVTQKIGLGVTSINNSFLFESKFNNQDRLKIYTDGDLSMVGDNGLEFTMQPIGGENSSFRMKNSSSLTLFEIDFDNNVMSNSPSIKTHNNADLNLLTASSADIKLGTANLERVTIKAGGNVGVGTDSPNDSAILELNSTTQGILIPRMTTTQRDAIVDPDESLLIYNLSVGGFEFYNGASWVGL